MKTSFLLGTSIALVCLVDAAVAQAPAEIATIAKAVTVEINLTQNKSIGSGVVIHKQGDVYTLLTNRHVVCPGKPACSAPLATETFQLKLGNGSSLKVPATAVKILGKDLDLAMMQFRSSSNLQVAKVAPPGSLKAGDRVYTSGYPLEPRGYSFNTGQAIAVVNKRLTEDRGGYTVVYNAETQPGMSGGGVFDTTGRIVAIHGQGEKFRENTDLPDVLESGATVTRPEVGSKIGYNRGIPVRWVVRGLAERGIKLGDRDPVTPVTAAIGNTADEYFITGFNKWVEPGSDLQAGKRQAIAAFTQAIRLNPRYEYAYFLRAIAYDGLKEYQLALADYNQAIAINPNDLAAYYNRGLLKQDKLNDPQGALADYNRAIAINPNFAVYTNRGSLKAEELNDPQGALADYNRAISLQERSANALNPNFAVYINRGNLKQNQLNDPQGALADYNIAILLNPNDATAYAASGKLKYLKLNDPQGALANFNRAIALNPNNVNAYVIRGSLKADELNDPQGALADFNRAISLQERSANALNPRLVNAYGARGVLKVDKFNDPQGALADFNRAIALNPNDATAYGARGTLKYVKLNDRVGGIADMQTAARLAKAQGNTQFLDFALQSLQSWGVKE